MVCISNSRCLEPRIPKLKHTAEAEQKVEKDTPAPAKKPKLAGAPPTSSATPAPEPHHPQPKLSEVEAQEKLTVKKRKKLIVEEDEEVWFTLFSRIF